MTAVRRIALVALALLMGVAVVGLVSAQNDDVKPGFLGVQLAEDEENGVVVASVVAESAADVAGLQEGDVITAVNGTAVSSASEVAELIAAMSAGDGVTLDITRDGEAMAVEATLGERPAAADFPRGRFGFRDNRGDRDFEMPDVQVFPAPGMMPGMMLNMMMGSGRLGVTFATLDEAVAAENEVALTDGALILEIADGSPAAEAGLLAKDVVTAVNGEPVDAERTLRDRLIAYEPGDVVSLTVARGEEVLTIDVTLGEQQMPQMGQFFMPFREGETPFDQFHFFEAPGDSQGSDSTAPADEDAGAAA
ncbi:MAG: PDZ domain-containing protein [Anaerolineae bacterium]|nr:PDZ domain-containing protein [Anaerolineae bacterium]NUQ03718.1 PDZ domain-containing protein [Anaerolineae bacterium]